MVMSAKFIIVASVIRKRASQAMPGLGQGRLDEGAGSAGGVSIMTSGLSGADPMLLFLSQSPAALRRSGRFCAAF
jgi:hypothetical protein